MKRISQSDPGVVFVPRREAQALLGERLRGPQLQASALVERMQTQPTHTTEHLPEQCVRQQLSELRNHGVPRLRPVHPCVEAHPRERGGRACISQIRGGGRRSLLFLVEPPSFQSSLKPRRHQEQATWDACGISWGHKQVRNSCYNVLLQPGGANY